MKRFFSVCLALVLLFSCGCSALAVEVPPPDQIADNLISDHGEWFNRFWSDNFDISYTSYGIEKKSSTSVFVAGTTRTNEKADIVCVLITVQQWKNNKWNNYDSISNRSVTSTECKHSDTISVVPGYYYRVHVTHDATQMFESRTLHSYSKSTLIQ